MSSSEALAEIAEAWGYVAFARMMCGFMLRKGQYNIDRRRCGPSIVFSRNDAEDMGIDPRLAAMLLGRRQRP